MANLFSLSRKPFVMCYCFREPIKTFFFDAWQMTVESRVLHLFLVPQTRRSHIINILLQHGPKTWLIRAFFTWLSKGIGFGFGFGFTKPFGWLVYLLWFWFYDSQVKTALTIIPRARMGSGSIAHEAEGRMGYWLRGHNIIVKYREQKKI